MFPRVSANSSLQLESIDNLIRRVESFRAESQLETLERIATENALLQRLIVIYEDNWTRTMHLIEQTQQALANLQSAIEKNIGMEKEAERDWLAYWGIREGRAEPLIHSPGGWI